MNYIQIILLALSVLYNTHNVGAHCPCFEKQPFGEAAQNSKMINSYMQIDDFLFTPGNAYFEITNVGAIGDTNNTYDFNSDYEPRCGTVWYTLNNDTFLLDKFNTIIQCQEENKFNGTSAFIVTWDDLKMLSSCSDDIGDIIQVVLVTDQQSTYLIAQYIQKKGQGRLMEWREATQISEPWRDGININSPVTMRGDYLLNTTNCCPGLFVWLVGGDQTFDNEGTYIGTGDCTTSTTLPPINGDHQQVDISACEVFGCDHCNMSTREQCADEKIFKPVDQHPDSLTSDCTSGGSQESSSEMMCMTRYKGGQDACTEVEMGERTKAWCEENGDDNGCDVDTYEGSGHIECIQCTPLKCQPA